MPVCKTNGDTLENKNTTAGPMDMKKQKMTPWEEAWAISHIPNERANKQG